jgi:hypothetical protein
MARAKKAAAKKAAPKKAPKKVETKAVDTKAVGRPKSTRTNKHKVLKAWDESPRTFPPTVGEKVRVFTPKAMRGRVAKVIASGDEKAKVSTRNAPKGKVRLMATIKGEKIQWSASQEDVFPSEYTLKQVDTLLD